MYYLKDFAEQLNLKDQLSDCDVFVTDSTIFINNQSFRLYLYGWPDNRVMYSDKVTGLSKIKRFGYNLTRQCKEYYIEMLNMIGVDTTILDAA